MTRSPRRLGRFLLVGLVVTLGIAFAVSPMASSQPDGLERVAIDEGFAETARGHTLAESPAADYAVRGIEDEGLSTGAAGIVGVVATFAAVTGGLWLLRRTRPHVGSDGRTEASTGPT